MTIISLSSIPPRFEMLQKTIRALLAQNSPISEIRVNIPRQYRRFPADSFSMPDLPEGARLCVVDEDLGPATKILPTLRDIECQDRPIIYCDDDRVPVPSWAGRLLRASRKHADACITLSGWDLQRLGVYPTRVSDARRAVHLRSLFDVKYRGHRLKQQLAGGHKGGLKPPRKKHFFRPGLLDIMEGFGGVLVKPAFFDPGVFEVPPKVWSVDDIWLSGMVAKANIEIFGVNGPIPGEILGSERDALYLATIEGLNRQQANLECVRYLQKEYGVWPE